MLFCQQRAGLEVLIKVTSKADRWKQSGKSFTKNWFLIAFFSITKKVFHLMFAKIFYLIPTQSDLQPAVSNFAAYGHELLVQYWHTQQAVWRFMVISSLPLPNKLLFWIHSQKISCILSTFLHSDEDSWLRNDGMLPRWGLRHTCIIRGLKWLPI